MEKSLKDLLLKDLCARLPYRVAIIPDGQTTSYRVVDIDFNKEVVVVKPKNRELIGVGCLGFEDFKLILRPMSSMTDEEIKEWDSICVMMRNMPVESIPMIERFVNSKHLDFRNLIPMGLALPATEGMYDF